MSGLTAGQPRLARLTPLFLASLDESVVSLDWSFDGCWLAAASASGSINILSLETGKSLYQWPGHKFGVTQIAWSPTSATLATAGQDGRVCLWTAKDGAPLEILLCEGQWVERLAWSCSGRYLAIASGCSLYLWDQQNRKLIAYPDHANTIADIAWRTQQEELVSACYGSLHFWSPGRTDVRNLLQWKGSMLSLAWSPDGRFLCHGNQDATVHFWVLATGKELQMSGYPTKVRALCWDESSRYLATGGGSSITVWDCSGKGPAGSRPSELKFHVGLVNSLAYQRGGSLLASGCEAGALALWTGGKKPKLKATATLPGEIIGTSWSPQGAFLAAGTSDGSLAVYASPEE